MYEPAQQIGGDFFQVVSDGAKGVLLVIGDVSGKGIPAAMLVGVIIGTIRALVHLSREPLTILSGLNQHLVGMTGNAFATAAVVRIQHDGDVSLANAGHLPPYFNGEPLDVPGSLPLGIDRNASYLPTAFHLNCGDRLTFYSDGVIEAQSPTGELFGFDRAGNISMSSAREIARQVQDFGQQDDITIVTVDRLCVGAGLSHSADFVTDRSL